MLSARVVVAKVFRFKIIVKNKMAKIIIHKHLSVDEINEQRLLDDFSKSHKQRMNKAFELMRLSMLFSKQNNVLYRKGIILKKS
jgi:hypothetical protein